MANTIRLKRGTTTPTAGVLVTGEVAINTTDGLAYTKTDAGDVVQIGGASNTALALIATVRNETGATLTKGTVVYVSGASSNKALVTKAIATGDPTSAGTYGLVQADILHNHNGTVVIGGIISGLNTDGYTNGDKIYLSPTTAGGWTTTKPSAPNHLVYIGTITYVHANQGAIQLRIQNGFEIEELHNVAISGSLADKDIISYNSSTELYENRTATALGLAPLDNPTFTGNVTAGTNLVSNYSAGDEGGEIQLAKPQTNTTLAGTVSIDIYQNKLRFFENGGSTRGAYLNLTDCSNGVATNLLSGGGGGGGISDAPADGYSYVRQMNSWIAVGSSTYETVATQEWVNLQSFLTSASLSGYATESYVTSQGYQTSSDVSTYVTGLGYLTDAPSDGSEYVRKNGAWSVATGGGGGGSAVWGGITGTVTDQTDLTNYITNLGYITDAPNDGKLYSRQSAGWAESRINDYDNFKTYQVGDQVVYNNAIYRLTNYIGSAGYDPVNYPASWTAVSGPSGTNGTNGTNGINGTMNPLDILTITANSYGAYVSSGTWSVNYTLINNGGMGGSWASNRYPTVYFNLYVNGVFDSAISGSYTYYYASGTPVTTTFYTGDHIEVRLSDGSGGEATLNYADFYI